MMAAWKVGPSLAAGCTVILKPSEFTPFTALCLADAAHAINLPAGVLNVLPGFGDVGAALCNHKLVDKISFTGSVPTGSKVMAAAAAGIKRVTVGGGGVGCVPYGCPISCTITAFDATCVRRG